MPTPNTTHSIQLSAISNLDKFNLPIPSDGVNSDQSFVDIANNLSIEVSYTTNNKIVSKKLALTDLFSAISSYVSYERSQTANTYLKVENETRTWKPKPTNNNSVIISPQINSNSDNNVNGCYILSVLSNKSNKKGQTISIDDYGSIDLRAGINYNNNDSWYCTMETLMKGETNEFIIRSKNLIQIYTTPYILNERIYNLSRNSQIYLNSTNDIQLSAGNQITVNAGSNYNSSNVIPIKLNSNNANSNAACVDIQRSGASEKDIKCIASKARWA